MRLPPICDNIKGCHYIIIYRVARYIKWKLCHTILIKTIYEENIMTIGDLIKYMRTTAGLNQVELSSLLGIAQNTLSGYETEYSMPNFDMVEKIAQICEYDIVFVDRNSSESIKTN